MLAHCISCGCHDYAACQDEATGGPCSWLAVDRAEGLGVCSACPEALERWNKGDRDFAVPVEPNDPKVAATHRPGLSEPQQILVDRLSHGARLQHEAQTTGSFRLTEAGRSRTVHPATVTSLVKAGVLIKDSRGRVTLATDR